MSEDKKNDPNDLLKNFEAPTTLELASDDTSLWDEIEQVIHLDLNEDPSSMYLTANGPHFPEMQSILVGMVGESLRPIHRYMKALAQGEENRDIFEISEMVVTSLIPKLEEVGLKDHMEEVAFFRSLLLLVLGERDQHALEKLKEVLLEGFEQLRLMFDVNCRGYRVAVRNLVTFYRSMKDTDNISDADIRKLFAIGISSLTWIRKTRSEEIASLSGISIDVVKEIRKLAHIHNALPSSAISLGRSFRILDRDAPRHRETIRPTIPFPSPKEKE